MKARTSLILVNLFWVFLIQIPNMRCRGGYQFGYDHSRFGQVLYARVEGYDETDGNYKRNLNPDVAAQSKLGKEDLARRRREIMRFGYPSLDNIKYKDDYVLSYNRRLRQANWVCEVCINHTNIILIVPFTVPVPS